MVALNRQLVRAQDELARLEAGASATPMIGVRLRIDEQQQRMAEVQRPVTAPIDQPQREAAGFAAEPVTTKARRTMPDALVGCARTDRLDLAAVADDIMADITCFTVRQAIHSPIAGWIGGRSDEGNGMMLAGLGYRGVVAGQGAAPADAARAIERARRRR